MLIKDALARWLRRWSGRPATETPTEAKAKFQLRYGGSTIGILELDNGKWQFQYTDEFRSHPKLRPLVEFPDTAKKYESRELWPFFWMRVPSLRQTTIQEVLKNEHLDKNDEVQLLRRFGRRTTANPFELIAE